MSLPDSIFVFLLRNKISNRNITFVSIYPNTNHYCPTFKGMCNKKYIILLLLCTSSYLDIYQKASQKLVHVRYSVVRSLFTCIYFSFQKDTEGYFLSHFIYAQLPLPTVMSFFYCSQYINFYIYTNNPSYQSIPLW